MRGPFTGTESPVGTCISRSTTCIFVSLLENLSAVGDARVHIIMTIFAHHLLAIWAAVVNCLCVFTLTSTHAAISFIEAPHPFVGAQDTLCTIIIYRAATKNMYLVICAICWCAERDMRLASQILAAWKHFFIHSMCRVNRRLTAVQQQVLNISVLPEIIVSFLLSVAEPLIIIPHRPIGRHT